MAFSNPSPQAGPALWPAHCEARDGGLERRARGTHRPWWRNCPRTRPGGGSEPPGSTCAWPSWARAGPSAWPRPWCLRSARAAGGRPPGPAPGPAGAGLRREVAQARRPARSPGAPGRDLAGCWPACPGPWRCAAGTAPPWTARRAGAGRNAWASLPVPTLALVGLHGGRPAGCCLALEHARGVVLGAWLELDLDWEGALELSLGGQHRRLPLDAWRAWRPPAPAAGGSGAGAAAAALAPARSRPGAPRCRIAGPFETLRAHGAENWSTPPSSRSASSDRRSARDGLTKPSTGGAARNPGTRPTGLPPTGTDLPVTPGPASAARAQGLEPHRFVQLDLRAQVAQGEVELLQGVELHVRAEGAVAAAVDGDGDQLGLRGGACASGAGCRPRCRR